MATEYSRACLLGYDLRLRGGVTGVTSSLLEELRELDFLPIMGVYGNRWRSAAYTARAFGRLTSRLLQRGQQTYVVVIGSPGDVIRTMPFILAIKLRRGHLVLYFHKSLRNILPERGNLRNSVLRLWRRASSLVFLSRGLAREGTEIFALPRHRMAVIGNGLSTTWAHLNVPSYEHRAFDVVFIGRWSAEKGVNDLEALFSDEGPCAVYTCHVFGGAPAGDRSGGSLRFHGWCSKEDVCDALRNARLLVLPSYSEAYPTVLLEAAACGTPFVSTAVAGIPDIAQASGGGVVVPAGDVAGLSNAIHALLQDEQKWYCTSRSGYVWVQEQTVKKTADEWRALLDSISKYHGHCAGST